jgi:hypothetical protein
VPGVALDGTGVQVPADHAAGTAVDDNDVEHLAAGKRSNGAALHLPHHRLIGAEE